MKKLAKSRLNKRLPLNERLKPITLFAFTLLLELLFWGYGKIDLMVDTWNSIEYPERKSIAIVQAKEVEQKDEFVPSSECLTIMSRNPGLTGKIRDKFGNDWRRAAELICKESSFNKYAINPTSGACGLGQSLPCSKMKCELEDEDCQLEWVKNYVADRYGNAKNALEFWQMKKETTGNGWY